MNENLLMTNNVIKKAIAFFAALSVFLLVFQASFSQTNISIEGVWKVTEIVEAGKTITDPQPGLFIFTKTYYSVAMLTSIRKGVEAPKERGKLTDAEKIARFEQWQPFIGISGTYELNGSRLVMHPIVAKAFWDMNREAPQESELKPEGANSILVIPTGDNATKAGLRMKMTRLE